MAIRITYDSNNIDILTDEKGLETRYTQERNLNRSASGKIETINQYGITEIIFHAVLSEANYRDLVAWWAWARQGKSWSFALDSGSAANTTLDAAAAADQKTIPLTATTGFAAGDYCLIRAEDEDNEFEIVEIDSVTANVSVTAVDNLIFAYTSSDVFRHSDYWPSLVLLDTNFSPEKRGEYFFWTFEAVEAL